MKNLYKIQDELYIIDNNEKVSQNGIWAKCSFTGDILKNRNGQYAYKVILTTNKLLIKDGVQAIEDEFLEWFVKNPSCEFVKVELDEISFVVTDNIYKIIIPKEEIQPQQIWNEERMYSEEEMVATFHYGHQIGMNSILSIQSQHSPKQLESPDLESLKEEWFEQFKKK